MAERVDDMKCVRIKLYQYHPTAGYVLCCDELYATDDDKKAREQFYKQYPWSDRPDCSCVSQTIDSDDLKWQEYIQAYLNR